MNSSNIVNAAPDFSMILGLSEDDARMRLRLMGFTMRVVESDGKACMVTDDLDANRLNVKMEEGFISSVYGIL